MTYERAAEIQQEELARLARFIDLRRLGLLKPWEHTREVLLKFVSNMDELAAIYKMEKEIK